MRPHASWAADLAGQPSQKTFKVAEGNDVVEVVLTIFQDENDAAGQIPESDASSAHPQGWGLSCVYKSAPDTYIFQQTFPTEREARGAFDDLSKACAEVEGLIRSEKMEDARKATDALMTKMKSNSGDTPILPTGQA